MFTAKKPFENRVQSEVPAIVRFARQRELAELEKSGYDVKALSLWQEVASFPFARVIPTPEKQLPALVHFARQHEVQRPKRSLESLLSPWDGLIDDPLMSLYHHAEPLMPLRGRDYDEMERFFNEPSFQDFLNPHCA